MGKAYFEIPAESAVNLAGTAIEFERTIHFRTYTGTCDDLIASGIAVETMFPEVPKRTKNVSCSDGSSDGFWELKKMKGGLFRLRVWPKQRSLGQESSPQRDDTVKSAEEYRWLLQNFMPMYLGLGPAAVSKFDGLRGVDGYLYCITAESRERIEEALEELLAAIDDAEVCRRKFDARTDEEKAAARELMARAEADPAFQVFLSKLTPRS